MALSLQTLIELYDAGNIIAKPGTNADAIVNQWRTSPDFARNAPVNDGWASIFTDPWGSQEPIAPAPPPPPAQRSPTPVPASGLGLAAGLTPASLSDPGSSPVANGFPLLRESFEMMLAADEQRRAAIDQEIRFQAMWSQLLGDDPAVAADLAVRLGMPGMEPDLSYLNRFSQGAVGTFGGRVGTQDISLPFSFSRNQLRFLDANPTVARAVQSVSERFRRPDVLQTSMMGAMPMSGIAGFGFSG